jgi:hypothetical protein
MPIIELLNIPTVAGGEDYAWPAVEGPAELFPKEHLAAFYLFENGSNGATLAPPYIDSSGNVPAHDGALIDTAPVKQSYGVQASASFFIGTGQVMSERGAVILAVRDFFALGDASAFPVLFDTSEGSAGSTIGGPISIINHISGGTGNDNRIGIQDKDSTEATAFNLAATTVSTNWNIICFQWDGPAGTVRIRSLIDDSGDRYDADFITYNAARIAAGRTIQVGGRSYQSANPGVKVDIGLILVYVEDIGETLIVDTMNAAAAHMVARGQTVAGYPG